MPVQPPVGFFRWLLIRFWALLRVGITDAECRSRTADPKEEHVLLAYLVAAARALSTARTTAFALFTDSSYSSSGTESATMPAPAWMKPCSPLRSMLRMAMQESKLPEKSA